MGWRFRKSIGVGKFFRVNLSKGGVGASAGLPGTGLSYVASPGRKAGAGRRPPRPGREGRPEPAVEAIGPDVEPASPRSVLFLLGGLCLAPGLLVCWIPYVRFLGYLAILLGAVLIACGIAAGPRAWPEEPEGPRP